MFTIYLHAFLPSLHPFEQNSVQSLPRAFRQNYPNANKKFRWSFNAISHQLSFDVAKKEKGKSPRVPNLADRGMRCLFHLIETDVIPRYFGSV
jgi:hypothetical protein